LIFLIVAGSYIPSYIHEITMKSPCFMVTPVNVHIDPAISNCACKIVFHYKPGPIFEGQTVKSNWRLKATNLTIAGWGPGSSSRSVEIWLWLHSMFYGRYNMI